MARILLIDDDTSLLDGLALAFEDAGYDVLTAPDGARGWALATDRAGTDAGPDLIVSDVNMPGMDGFTLCRKLREAGQSVPIVLLTARDNEIDEALGLELGADDYVSKPFSTRILLARVQALLRERGTVHAAGHDDRDVLVARNHVDARGGQHRDRNEGTGALGQREQLVGQRLQHARPLHHSAKAHGAEDEDDGARHLQHSPAAE